MRRWILVGIFSFFSCIAVILLAALGAGELLSGAVPTAVNTLSIDLPVEPVEIPVYTGAREASSNVRGWLVRGERGRGMVLLVHSLRSNRVEMLSRARFLNRQGYGALLIDLRAHGETPGERI